jgi:dTDP-4-dehydrorhamnose 3,5-epimerase
MIFDETPLSGLFNVRTHPVADERGRFVRIFCDDEFSAIHAPLQWRQSNLSITKGLGAIRGMHFQHPPAAETKLVRCLRGRVFDVAVDVRRDSPTFLAWHGVELTADNDTMLLIPEGFAHGFQVLEGEAELLYMHSAAYSPRHDGRLRFDDPRVGIAWPLPPGVISQRDLDTPTIDDTFTGVTA